MFSTVANWWKRLVHISTGYGEKDLEQLHDPEMLLEQAQEEMREMHAKNRERMVQAITQKSNLQVIVFDTEKTIEKLQAKADLAGSRGDYDLMANILKKKQGYETILRMTRNNLEQTIETVEAVEIAYKREDEKIQQKAAEALTLKAQWKESQIQIAMIKALGGIQGVDDTEQRFGKAIHRIRTANAMQLLIGLSAQGLSVLREKANAARGVGDFETESALLREIEQGEAALTHLHAAFEQYRKIPFDAPEENPPLRSDALLAGWLTGIVVVLFLIVLFLLALLFKG